MLFRCALLPIWAAGAVALGQAVLPDDQTVLPEDQPAPPVQPIEPIPEREDVPFGTPEGLIPTVPDSLRIENDGPIEFNSAAATIRYAGSVAVRGDNGMQLFADAVLLDTKAKTVTLDGNVSVYHGSLLQRGDHAVYNYDSATLEASGMRASIDPILLESGRFHTEQRDGEPVYVGQDAGITTHDFSDPNFWVRADTTTVYPGEKVTFRNLKLYAGDTPVFWLPYLSQPLDAELGYHFIPGARSNWGAYLLNTYGIMLGGEDGPFVDDHGDQWLLSRWKLDLRARRGLAAGLDLLDLRHADNPALTGLQLYYANDLDPSIRRSGMPREAVNEDRWHLGLRHSLPLQLPDDAEYLLRSNLSALSDRYYLEDFEPRTYRTDPEPDNTLGLFRRDDQSVLGAILRLPLNDFYQTASRLPEITYDQVRRPLFGGPLLHEGQTSIGSYREELADYAAADLRAQIRSLPPGHPDLARLAGLLRPIGFQRFHTWQELALPTNVGGWLTLVPRAGAGYTNYWAVEDPAEPTDRTHLHAGLEASLKFSRAFPNVDHHDLGLDGLLHVIQPYAEYSFLATDQLDPTFRPIDRLTFSTRPRPLSVGAFTAIDDLEDWSILRTGVRNRLVTRRDGANHEWLLLDTYIDQFFHDPELDRNCSNLYNDLWWRPLPWCSLGLETQFPIVDGGSGFNELTTILNFMPNENLEFTLGYRKLDNHPQLLDSDRIDLRAYARLNEHWGLGFLQRWELDDHTLEVQQYTIHRDLGNWIAGVGLTQRDNRIDDEYGVVFSLTLKDFPSISLPFEIDAE